MRNPYARTFDVLKEFEDMVHQNPTRLPECRESGVRATWSVERSLAMKICLNYCHFT